VGVRKVGSNIEVKQYGTALQDIPESDTSSFFSEFSIHLVLKQDG